MIDQRTLRIIAAMHESIEAAQRLRQMKVNARPALNRMILLDFVQLELTDEGAVSHFLADGASWGALPHDAPHYHYLAYRDGHNGDIRAYCRAHELCHHLIAEGFGMHSPTIFALAHGEQPSPMIAAAEEALAHTLHRYAMIGEPPLIEGVDWDRLKRRFLELVQ